MKKYFLKEDMGLNNPGYVKDYDFINPRMIGVTITPTKQNALKFDSKHIAKLNAECINEKSFIKVEVVEEE